MVPGDRTGLPCQWGTLIQKSGPPDWGLDASLTTLLCKKVIVVISKEVKTECSNIIDLAESSEKGCGSKRAILPMTAMKLLCKYAVFDTFPATSLKALEGQNFLFSRINIWKVCVSSQREIKLVLILW
jgi:hypothetical protein